MSNFNNNLTSMSVRSNKCRLKVPVKSNTLFKKLHVIIILLSVVFCHNVFAQREKINTLKKILPSLYDSTSIDCLNELSGIYLRSLPAKRPVTNPKVVDTAAYYTERAYREAVKINYTHGIAESLSYKGEIENIFDNFLAQEKFSREAVA